MSSLRQHHRRHPRVLSRPVNSGRCEHHQRAAGTFKGFTRHPSRTITPVFTRFYSPASSSLSRTVHLRSRHFFFLLLIVLSSSSTRHSIYRPFRIFSFLVVPIFSFDFFSSPSPSRSPLSLERARRSFVLGRKKIAARRDTQRASPIFRYANAGDRTSGRAGGRIVCGMKKIVREKSECSYQSAMQTRGFASVMPGERERKKRNIDVERRGYMKRRLAHEEREKEKERCRSILIIVSFNIGNHSMALFTC